MIRRKNTLTRNPLYSKSSDIDASNIIYVPERIPTLTKSKLHGKIEDFATRRKKFKLAKTLY